MGIIQARFDADTEKELIELSDIQDQGNKSETLRKIVENYLKENVIDRLDRRIDQVVDELASLYYRKANLSYKQIMKDQKCTTLSYKNGARNQNSTDKLNFVTLYNTEIGKICNTIMQECMTKTTHVLQNKLVVLQNRVRNEAESVLQDEDIVTQELSATPEEGQVIGHLDSRFALLIFSLGVAPENEDRIRQHIERLHGIGIDKPRLVQMLEGAKPKSPTAVPGIDKLLADLNAGKYDGILIRGS